MRMNKVRLMVVLHYEFLVLFGNKSMLDSTYVETRTGTRINTVTPHGHGDSESCLWRGAQSQTLLFQNNRARSSAKLASQHSPDQENANH
jgi:hypothetical protein